MIIPKRDAQYYGAVHIDNYLTFTGFCKKVDSDEICDVDVFVDGKKIDTLKADKKIGKVEDIYDIEGHGFEFELSDEYFEKSHTLEFKASSGEELVNSKIQTINKNHPKFNEYRFLHSLSNVDVEKVKDLYCKDAIGFLAIEENLNDKDFMEYIRELMEKFPDVAFKAFYFNEDLVHNLLNISDNLKCSKLLNVNNLFPEICMYIYDVTKQDTSKIFGTFVTYNCHNIFSIVLDKNYKNLTLKDLDKRFLNHVYLNKRDYFGLEVIDDSFVKTFINFITEGFMKEIDLNMNAKLFFNFLLVELLLKNRQARFLNYELNRKYYLLHNQ